MPEMYADSQSCRPRLDRAKQKSGGSKALMLVLSDRNGQERHDRSMLLMGRSSRSILQRVADAQCVPADGGRCGSLLRDLFLLVGVVGLLLPVSLLPHKLLSLTGTGARYRVTCTV